ncbi:MAG TPA: glycosyltransferase [Vitreimonas sp.]|nr:glycosyltransferase [Vitreimonas sp.]
MKVLNISDKSGYAQNNNKFFELDKFSKQAGDFVLIVGGFEEVNQWDQFGLSDTELQALLKKKIVRMEFEEPNKFFIGDDTDSYDHYFHKILTLCPYTAEWLNKKHGNKKRIPIFYPFNKKHIPAKAKKKYDIVYAGHIVSQKVFQDIQTISKFNYRFISNSDHPLVTNRSATHEEKMKIVAQSKITLVHNMLSPKPYHFLNIWRYPEYQKNEAFKEVPPWYQPWKVLSGDVIVPQLKARLFEAAFGRSLILCKRDPFNIIERYFEPNKEFIYFDEDTLESSIEMVLADYPKYQKMIDRAFKRATKEYTTEAFFKKYLKNLVK